MNRENKHFKSLKIAYLLAIELFLVILDIHKICDRS